MKDGYATTDIPALCSRVLKKYVQENDYLWPAACEKCASDIFALSVFPRIFVCGILVRLYEFRVAR